MGYLKIEVVNKGTVGRCKKALDQIGYAERGTRIAYLLAEPKSISIHTESWTGRRGEI